MFENSSILITGGTGSFWGKMRRDPGRNVPAAGVIVYSRDELKQFEMSQRFNSPPMRFFLGDVRRLSRQVNSLNKYLGGCRELLTQSESRVSQLRGSKPIGSPFLFVRVFGRLRKGSSMRRKLSL
jgi:Polysaccharide biosynthesis protein